MSSSDLTPTLVSKENDNHSDFYNLQTGAPDTTDRGEQIVRSKEVLMRITPAEVHLAKGAPVDFTVHIKALHDFDTAHPLVLRLLPVVGRGTARFATPDAEFVVGEPVVRTRDGIIEVTMKATDAAAKVIITTEYPADWWAGTTSVLVEVNDSVESHHLEGTVIVADRVPAAWKRNQ